MLGLCISIVEVLSLCRSLNLIGAYLTFPVCKNSRVGVGAISPFQCSCPSGDIILCKCINPEIYFQNNMYLVNSHSSSILCGGVRLIL